VAYIINENGEYKRTVRCSHCWEKGHNKSSCPDRKTQLTKRIKDFEAAIAKDDYDSSYRRDNDQRYLADAKAQLDKMLNKGKGRECSYCAQTGHNRRTCQYRKNDIAAHTEKTKTFREKFVEKMSEIGLGVGAIVRQTIRTKDDNAVSALAFVESVNWDEMDYRDMYQQNSYYLRCSNILRLRVLGDYIDRWDAKVTTVGGSPPPSVVNTEDFAVESETLDRSSRQYAGVQVVSGVDAVHPPNDYFDDKTISNLMIKEIVDAK